MVGDFLTLLMDVLGILNYLFAIFIVFSERKNPAVTWAWLMVLTLIPYFGFLIYLVLGLDSRKHHVFTEKTKQDEDTLDRYMSLDMNSDAFIQQQFQYINQKNVLPIPGSEHMNDMVYLNLISGYGAFTKNNEVETFHEGKAKFESLLKDIENAKHYVHLQYYIVRNDNLGRRIIDALAQKAAQGVDVRFLIDGMGCMRTPRKFYKPLLKAGGLLGVFLPPHFVRINFRNHRKLAVIDGQIGYIGGLNIGDEYLGEVKRFGYWRDSHVRITGEAVRQLELRFAMDWNFCSSVPLPLADKLFPPIQTNEEEKGVSMQIVCSGPDTRWPSIQYGYAKMMHEADRSIFIATPYFVPDDSIFEALRIAALSGIDVRVVIPAHPDHVFVYWASLSYLGELLKAGIKCYQYEKGFVHSKLVMIDGIVTSVGTANMDVRSFKLNFEINAFIYDEKTTCDFEARFIKDLEDCTRIDDSWYASRSAMTKIKESVSRLLSPLL